jgi:hypothetical protein
MYVATVAQIRKRWCDFNSISGEDKISADFHEISRGFMKFRGSRPEFLRCAQH